MIIIRDRIDYTVQNLLISKYEHMFAFFLEYQGFCTRTDVFLVLMRIYKVETEEEYLAALKTFIAFVKLVAPELMALYEATEKLNSYWRLIGYDPEFDMYALRELKTKLVKECKVYREYQEHE